MKTSGEKYQEDPTDLPGKADPPRAARARGVGDREWTRRGRRVHVGDWDEGPWQTACHTRPLSPSPPEDTVRCRK